MQMTVCGPLKASKSIGPRHLKVGPEPSNCENCCTPSTTMASLSSMLSQNSLATISSGQVMNHISSRRLPHSRTCPPTLLRSDARLDNFYKQRFIVLLVCKVDLGHFVSISNAALCNKVDWDHWLRGICPINSVSNNAPFVGYNLAEILLT